MQSLAITCEEFRQLARQVTELCADYLSTLDAQPIFPGTRATETERLFHRSPPETGMGADAIQQLQDVVANSRAQNGRFFGYVLGSGEPVAALGDLLASVINQNVTAWRSGPAAITLERTVVEWIAEAIGCAGFYGSLTGGGSSANLMGLAMAREARAPANEGGLFGTPPCVVYASEQVHMSVAKSVALLGLGRESLRLIAVDEEFCIKCDALESAIDEDRRAGKIPIAVVASAGTVNTGAIDPLQEIATVAHRNGLWFHIDGAYGALAAMAIPEKFDGIAMADSLSLDPHKWLFQPLDCGCLLYRDRNQAQKAFAHTGDYAKVLASDPIEGFAFFEESLELSRRFRALKLWLSLRYHGFDAFRAAIRNNLELAHRLAKAVAELPELELLAPVELSAVCFRYRFAEESDRLNAELLRRVVERGRVYLSNTTLQGQFCLRVCITNHRTTEADVDAVISEVLATAAEISE